MKISFKKYFYKFLDYLQGKPVMGGLEVSDSAVRFSYFNGKIWKLESIKVPNGILKGGQMIDRGQFLEVLKRLKNNANRKQRMTAAKTRSQKPSSFSFLK